MKYQQQSQEEGFYPQELQIEQRVRFSRNKEQQRPRGFKPYQVVNLPQMSKFPTQTLESFTSIPIIQTPEEYLNLIRKHSQYKDSGHFQNLFEKYAKHPESYRLLYSRYGAEITNKHSQTFTQRNFPLPSLLGYEESEYRLLKELSFQEMKSRSQSSSLEFDSRFQSGNLFCVYQSLASDYCYHCLVENDTNTNGYNQWFYFSLRGVKKNTLYRFVIPNMRKRYSFFRTGMKPILFSQNKLKRTGSGWFSRGYNVRYEKSDLFFIKENQKRSFYSLSFELDFDQDDDFVTISNGMPYTYSRLIHQLTKCRELALENQVFWEMTTANYSLSNNQVPQIIVTSHPEEKEEMKSSIKKYRLQGQWKGSLFSKKKVIVILARQHSSEVNSSFLVEELLYALAKRGNYKIAWLLDNFEFRIYPMVNVDGVIYGNTRTDLFGCDLNRVWRRPLKELQPQIYSIKKQVINLHKYNRIAYVLDLHSHSRNYNIFSYGFKYDEVTSRLFSHLMSKLCLHFDLSNSSLGVHSHNQKTARGVLAQKIGFMKVTTLETSYYGAKEEGEVKMFQPRIFAEIAKGVLNTLKSYLRNDRLKKESLKFIQDNVSSDKEAVSNVNYMSDSEPEDEECFCEGRLKMLIPSELARKRITKKINYPSESEEEENKQLTDRSPRRPRWEESAEKQIQSQRVVLSKEEKTHKITSVKGKARLSTKSITQQQPKVSFKKYEQSNLSVWKKQLAWLKKTKTEPGEHSPPDIGEGEGKGLHLVTQSQKRALFDDNIFQKQMKRLYKNLRSDKRDLNLKNYKIKRDNQFLIRNSKESPRHDGQCARNEGSLNRKTKIQGIKSLLLSEVKDEGSAIFRIRSSYYSQGYDQNEKMNCSAILERNFEEEFKRLKLQYSQRCNAKLVIASKLLKKQQRASFRK